MKSKVKVILSLTLAVMLMTSLAVLATPSINDPISISEPVNGTYTVTAKIVEGSTGLNNKQVTMLVYKGSPSDTSIIGIDQGASDTNGDVSFSFGTDSSTPLGTYTVLVGGEEVNNAVNKTFDITSKLATVEKPVWSGKSITWTAVANASSYTVVLSKGASVVTTVADQTGTSYDFTSDIETAGDGSYTATVQAIGSVATYYDNGDASVASDALDYVSATPEPTAEPTPEPTAEPTSFTVSGNCPTIAFIDGVDDLNAAWAVTANLRPTFSSDPIQTVTVDNQTGAFAFADVANGSYVITLERAGFITRAIGVTVDGADADVGVKELIAGDVYFDFIVDGSDTSLLFSVLGAQYGDENYNPSLDVYPDGIIDGSDTSLAFANLGLDITAYGEDVDFGS